MTDDTDIPNSDNLNAISHWDPADYYGLMKYVMSLWHWPEYARKEVSDNGDIRYYLDTGGWSGNEEIIAAIQSNHMWWLMYWYQSTRGGHYEFRKLGDRDW